MITRFAPSPTGPLHLGHAFSVLTAWGRAQAAGGTFLLRIEDIDTPRCRPAFEAAIVEDLRWLGLDWPEPVMRQSERMPAYRAALGRLADLGVLYPCRCTRGDIRAALSAPQEGADALPYPGTCRGRPMAEAGAGCAIRLDIARACALAGPLSFRETGPLHEGIHALDAATIAADGGDIVLARRDIGTSYALAVTLDDAAQSDAKHAVFVTNFNTSCDATPLPARSLNLTLRTSSTCAPSAATVYSIDDVNGAAAAAAAL